MKRLAFVPCLPRWLPVGRRGVLRLLSRKCAALGQAWRKSAIRWGISRVEQGIFAHTPKVSELERRILDREFGILGLRFQISVEEFRMARQGRGISSFAWQKSGLCWTDSFADCADSAPHRPDRGAEWSRRTCGSTVSGGKPWNLVLRREVPAWKFQFLGMKSEILTHRSANFRRERRKFVLYSLESGVGGEVFPLAPPSFSPAGAVSTLDLRNRGPPEAAVPLRS